jgi:hypothetical protein
VYRLAVISIADITGKGGSLADISIKESPGKHFRRAGIGYHVP